MPHYAYANILNSENSWNLDAFLVPSTLDKGCSACTGREAASPQVLDSNLD